jgi:hypothetical protein
LVVALPTASLAVTVILAASSLRLMRARPIALSTFLEALSLTLALPPFAIRVLAVPSLYTLARDGGDTVAFAVAVQASLGHPTTTTTPFCLMTRCERLPPSVSTGGVRSGAVLEQGVKVPPALPPPPWKAYRTPFPSEV